jgi:hypothetical protein
MGAGAMAGDGAVLIMHVCYFGRHDELLHSYMSGQDCTAGMAEDKKNIGAAKQWV